MSELPRDLEIFYTADGTPTLSFARADGYTEKMHHSAGALGESVFIYHEALSHVLDAVLSPAVLSVGLGLGYNEMLVVAEMMKRGRDDYKIWSFETHPVLRDGFSAWSRGNADENHGRVLNEVCRSVATRLNVNPENLKQTIRVDIKTGRLELRAKFPDDAAGVVSNLVFYDAYSRKMDELLWTEENLVGSLDGVIGTDCVFATYAATGSLNRALRRLGFGPSRKPGFMGKRESTMAFRGRVG